jgi:hypothetical protein
MIGHVAAAVHPVDGDSLFLELLLAPEQVLLMTASPKGVDVRMLKKE